MIAPPEVMRILERLSKALDERQAAVKEAEDWYDGEHPIPEPPKNTFAAVDTEARQAFTNLARLGITNLLPPVVDVPAGKVTVEGFRFSQTPRNSDNAAWEMWQRNHLDEDSDLVIHTSVKIGQAFGTVWADSDDMAEITVEDPSQAIVAYEAGSRRKRVAGLKRWVDEDGYVLATLYLPDFLWKFRSASAALSDLWLPLTAGRDPAGRYVWEKREVSGEQWPLPNPFGEVNLVEIRSKAPLKALPFGGGQPFFQKQINEQRKLNQTVLNLLTTMEHQAFRQRWSIGWPAPTDDDGNPDRHALLKAAASSLAVFNHPDGEDQNIRVGEFAQADFRGFLDVMLAWVKVIASTSGTPPYAFLLGDMINVAADSLARIDGVLKGNVIGLQRSQGDGLRELVRLGLKAQGDQRAADPAMSVVFAEPEERTAKEQAELAQTMHDLGAPDEAVFAALPGVTQQEARRWVLERNGQSRLSEALARAADAAVPPS